MSFVRAKRLLRALRFVFEPYREPRRPTYVESITLAAKQAEARARLPENSIRAVHTWPVDANGSPIDYEDLPV